MSTRYNNGSHYENHDRAEELHEGAAHAHSVAEQQGQAEHLTGHERERQALEHTEEPHRQSQQATVGHGVVAFGHADIAARAYELWLARGGAGGSPEEDWHQAVKELRSRHSAH